MAGLGRSCLAAAYMKSRTATLRFLTRPASGSNGMRILWQRVWQTSSLMAPKSLTSDQSLDRRRPLRVNRARTGPCGTQPTIRPGGIVLGISLSIVPSHCRAFDVGSRRAACPAVGALHRERAVAHDLGAVPTKWTWLQYRDDVILFHLLLVDRTERICLISPSSANAAAEALVPGWPAGAQLPIAAGRSGDAGAQYRHHRHHPELSDHRADQAYSKSTQGIRAACRHVLPVATPRNRSFCRWSKLSSDSKGGSSD